MVLIRLCYIGINIILMAFHHDFIQIYCDKRKMLPSFSAPVDHTTNYRI